VLRAEIDWLQDVRMSAFKSPTADWIQERVSHLVEMLEPRVERSALILRKLLGTIRLQPVQTGTGRPYYQAISELNVLPLLKEEAGKKTTQEGSNSLHWWRRRESNPRGPPVTYGISNTYLSQSIACTPFEHEDISIRPLKRDRWYAPPETSPAGIGGCSITLASLARFFNMTLTDTQYHVMAPEISWVGLPFRNTSLMIRSLVVTFGKIGVMNEFAFELFLNFLKYLGRLAI